MIKPLMMTMNMCIPLIIAELDCLIHCYCLYCSSTKTDSFVRQAFVGLVSGRLVASLLLFTVLH